MFEGARAWLVAQVSAAKPSFLSRSPHFNFISAHCEFCPNVVFSDGLSIYRDADATPQTFGLLS